MFVKTNFTEPASQQQISIEQPVLALLKQLDTLISLQICFIYNVFKSLLASPCLLSPAFVEASFSSDDCWSHFRFLLSMTACANIQESISVRSWAYGVQTERMRICKLLVRWGLVCVKLLKLDSCLRSAFQSVGNVLWITWMYAVTNDKRKPWFEILRFYGVPQCFSAR